MDFLAGVLKARGLDRLPVGVEMGSPTRPTGVSGR
jgi:hypothetical protein